MISTMKDNRKINIGLHAKSTLLVTCIIVFVALVISGVFTSRQKNQAYSDLKKKGIFFAKYLAYNSEYGVLIKDDENLNKLLKGLAVENDISYIMIHDLDGKVLASTKNGIEKDVMNAEGNEEAIKVEEKYINELVLLKGGKKDRIMDIAYPVTTTEDDTEILFESKSSNKRKIGVVRLGMTFTNARKLIAKNRNTTIFLILVIIILSTIITNVLVKNLFIKTIKQLLSAAQAIGQGNLNSEIKINTKDELGKLATAFKNMQINLSSLAEQAKSVSEGNLTDDVKFKGDLADAFNLMSENLRSLARQISDASSDLDTFSNDILSAMKDHASGTTQLATSTAEVSATVEELSTAAKKISDNADLVAKMAENSLNNTQTGKSAVYESFKGIEAIKESTKESVDRISALGKKSQRISEIIEIIDNIGEKTKLLSLNASIEAARAGAAGKGFSVVAGEIRRLSEIATESVMEVKNIIKEIQTSINTSIMSSDKMNQTVDQGLQLSIRVGESLEEILSTVEKTADYANQIRHSTQQQKTASEQVSVTIRAMASNSKQTADIANEITAITKKVTELSAKLKTAINQLKFK